MFSSIARKIVPRPRFDCDRILVIRALNCARLCVIRALNCARILVVRALDCTQFILHPALFPTWLEHCSYIGDNVYQTGCLDNAQKNIFFNILMI